jgi:MOSC domain-containing protein
MSVVGHVESVWRYPVKSMRGEKVASAFVGFAGVYGDRLYAFQNSAAVAGFPFLTAREQAQMLLHQPRFRHAEKALQPPNLAEAEHLAPGVTPVYPSWDDLVVDIVTPDGAVVAIDSPALRERLGKTEGAGELALLRSDRAMTDCRPVSLISTQTLGALSREVGKALDQRRFRANFYVDLGAAAGSAEDAFVGRKLKIGSKAVIAVLERDPRCRMINLDPDTGQASPEVLQTVAKAHEGRVGIYGAVLVEGTVRPGDEVTLLN